MTPFKYPLKTGDNTLQIPGGLFGCHFAFQHDVPTLWTTANTDKPDEEFHIYVALTGEPIPYDRNRIGYMGTAVFGVGSYVVHAYLIEKEPS